MNIVKNTALISVFGIGCIGLGLVSTLAGGIWGTVLIVWIAFWVIVGTLAEFASPTYD